MLFQRCYKVDLSVGLERDVRVGYLHQNRTFHYFQIWGRSKNPNSNFSWNYHWICFTYFSTEFHIIRLLFCKNWRAKAIKEWFWREGYESAAKTKILLFFFPFPSLYFNNKCYVNCYVSIFIFVKTWTLNLLSHGKSSYD